MPKRSVQAHPRSRSKTACRPSSNAFAASTAGAKSRMFKDQLTLPLHGYDPAGACSRRACLRQSIPTSLPRLSSGFQKDERQRVLWPSTIRLSRSILKACKSMPCPSTKPTWRALAHTAMGLDIYAWLAQRLHRIDPRKPAFIAWTALKEQFGPDYQADVTISRHSFRNPQPRFSSRYQTARYRAGRQGHDSAQQPSAGQQTDHAHIETQPLKNPTLDQPF